MWDCASHLWVPGWSRAWASISHFLPHNSATFQFKVLMSMQIDTYLKMEQIGTLFVWVGAPEGGFGWWVRGSQPKNRMCLPSKNIFLPPVCRSPPWKTHPPPCQPNCPAYLCASISLHPLHHSVTWDMHWIAVFFPFSRCLKVWERCRGWGGICLPPTLVWVGGHGLNGKAQLGKAPQCHKGKYLPNINQASDWPHLNFVEVI